MQAAELDSLGQCGAVAEEEALDHLRAQKKKIGSSVARCSSSLLIFCFLLSAALTILPCPWLPVASLDLPSACHGLVLLLPNPR